MICHPAGAFLTWRYPRKSWKLTISATTMRIPAAIFAIRSEKSHFSQSFFPVIPGTPAFPERLIPG